MHSRQTRNTMTTGGLQRLTIRQLQSASRCKQVLLWSWAARYAPVLSQTSPCVPGPILQAVRAVGALHSGKAKVAELHSAVVAHVHVVRLHVHVHHAVRVHVLQGRRQLQHNPGARVSAHNIQQVLLLNMETRSCSISGHTHGRALLLGTT